MSFLNKLSTLFFGLQALLLCSLAAAAFSAETSQPEVAHFPADAAGLYQRSSQVIAPAGTDALILDDEEMLVYDGDGRVVRSQYVLYKVLTQKGAEEWGSESFNWEPWHQEHPTLRARVITPDNAVHLLDEKTITDAPAKEHEDNVFSDRRVVRAPLPAVAPGSLVEVEYGTRETAPFFGAGVVQRFYFGGASPVHHTRLVLDAPKSLPLRYEMHLLPDLKPERIESADRVRITFDNGPMDSLDDADPDLPANLPAFPSVVFSTGASWQQVAGEYGKIVDQQIAGADLHPLVSKLTAGKKTHDEKAAAILQYLDREVRYTGIEFGESALIPHPPSEILSHKYGDCKDKAALLVAVLRTAKVPAYLALLRVGGREDLAPGLPGMGLFDHAIVYVPGNPELWIDATNQYARLGEIPNVDQERRALVVRPESAELRLTPANSSARNTVVERREIVLAENGPARIIETTEPHGIFEASYRRAYTDKENKAAKDELTNYVKTQFLADKLDRIDRSDPNDLSQQFVLTLECDHARRGSTEFTNAAAAIRLEALFNPLPAELREAEKEDDAKAEKGGSHKPRKKRTADYELPAAYVTEWHYTIVPPAGFSPKPLPSNTQISLGPATLTEEFAADQDGVVHASVRFDTVKRHMTAQEGADLRNKVVQIVNGEAIVIYFEPLGESLLSQGKVRDALQSYRELIALHPQSAVYHLRIAEALLAAGLGEAARAEAQAAIKLDPNSALAEEILADILEYDLVGRKFRPGSDYAGAEAAFRAAEKLDPDDKAVVANLAILLEFNRFGLRYGPGARLKEAAAEYRKLTPEKLGDLGVKNNLAFTLFYAGAFSEAEQNAETLNPQPIALIVACEAALNGSQSGLAEARKRTGDDDQFRGIAKTAGDMLVNIRKYVVGADLMEAGASGSDASGTVALASLYRKTQLHEQMQFPDDPAGVALHFEVLTDDPDLSFDAFRSLCSRNGKIGFATTERWMGYAKGQRGTQSSKARQGEFYDVGTDLSMTRAQPSIQGNDATGYKVTLWPSASYKIAYYVVKEDGHYRILARSTAPSGLGLEVLDRVAANNLAGARTLLDWLRKDEHLAGGDDPLAGDPFPRFWARGKNADASAMKWAAAAILVNYEETAAQGLAILEVAAKDPTLHEVEKTNILVGLLRGYWRLQKSDMVLAVSRELALQFPESDAAFSDQSNKLRTLGRFDEADRLVEDRLKRIPDDNDALFSPSWNAAARGDFARAHAMGQKLIDAGLARPGDLNDIAWFALFTGKVEPSDIEDALKATQLDENNASTLHTLGCAYAEVGKTKEAREVLIQAMDLLNLDEPDDNYWYAFGRIAEQYGEHEVALADYSRVSKPKQAQEIPDSTFDLAQIRLRVLGREK